MNKITKWYTTSEYIDVTTGEIISKKVFEKEYYKVKTNKKIEINENIGNIRYQNECRPIGQKRLFD